MGIGELAKIGNCSVEIIRHYEKLKLLTSPPRTNGGHRQYGALHVQQLSFIRNSRSLGFSLDETAELLAMISTQNVSCKKVKNIAEKQLTRVRERILEFQQMEASLVRAVNKCHGEDEPDCAFVEHAFLMGTVIRCSSRDLI